ncbi:glycosyltransferase [Pseudomonas dryadis]|uniref:Glycosyltransferase n=2 Tax=Pseudomonadales TaxID=72274 RepID=A0A4Q9QW78_9GAMM|nr:glycosyltransferase [Pseudomonas dryadis]TBV05497.1 glycosyltransferase [Pseudomonas dryadis]TBV18507.1 glycosyltransferase [Pseudomonas sp. FRB 230]
MILGFLNQHGYNIAHNNPAVRRNFMQMNYLLRDGIGVKLACSLNGLQPKANLNGSDFIPRLIDHLLSDSNSDNYQLFAMGTQEPWLSEGARTLFGGKPFHAIDGFQPTQDYIDFIRQHRRLGKTPIIVMAMGMPRQEEIAALLQRELQCPALMICGGAILDFSAQRFSRAPEAVRKLGMEWLFRLAMEPRRLFKRYIVGIPQFFYYVARNGLNSTVRVSEQRAYDRKS